jgi:transcriptional regulator with XRE-family HTH domain
MILDRQIPLVNPQQVGKFFRAVRRKRGLRQLDVAALVGISDSTVSEVERGHWRSLSFATLERLAAALDIRLDLTPSWRGGDDGRLLSRPHSLLASSFAEFVAKLDEWDFVPEVSFSVYGERGVLDQFGLHRPSGNLVVIELKTEFVDINETLGTLDRKVRLAKRIAAERGWAAGTVSCWLIVADTRTNRRHARDHAALLRAKLPADGRQLRGFFRDPASAAFGMSFWTDSSGRGVGPKSTGARTRIRQVGGPVARISASIDASRPGTGPKSGSRGA